LINPAALEAEIPLDHTSGRFRRLRAYRRNAVAVRGDKILCLFVAKNPTI
jgi:hypothetical protein